MRDELVWANVMRPRIPLVYLDLNTIIYIARTLRRAENVPAGFGELYEAALRAKMEKRALFPLGEAHLWEISKITDPKQRGRLAEILENLSDYNYLLGRTVIAELEFEAGIAKVMGEDLSGRTLPLIRPTLGQVFGQVGGMKFVNDAGGEGSDAIRAEVGEAEFDSLLANLNYEFERRMLRGPSDEDLAQLQKDPNFRPEQAIDSHKKRVLWELDTERVLNADPRWRRGRLRDVIGAREIVHEWLDLFNRLRIERMKSGLFPFDPSEEEMRSFMGSMPHTQVAVSIKTRYHRDSGHKWTANDITDIDAMSVAFAYCETVFPDKAIRSALTNSKELAVLGTYVPRRAAELTEWLNALPSVVAPEILMPHPLGTPI
jgi:hypothetical protein